jgi:hypothetical protein
MNMHLIPLTMPVEQAYGGGDTLNIRKLQDFCLTTNANFMTTQTTLDKMTLRLREVNAVNKQLTQLLNWIAVTNPQILDEFQTTAHAFDKLVPREPSEFAVPQSAA